MTPSDYAQGTPTEVDRGQKDNLKAIGSLKDLSALSAAGRHGLTIS
jgi:hypothetical protein